MVLPACTYPSRSPSNATGATLASAVEGVRVNVKDVINFNKSVHGGANVYILQ